MYHAIDHARDHAIENVNKIFKLQSNPSIFYESQSRTDEQTVNDQTNQPEQLFKYVGKCLKIILLFMYMLCLFLDIWYLK